MAKKKNKRKPTPQVRPQLKPAFQAPQMPDPNLKPATVSLSIIVKNEAKVIERMLNSVYPILDYYVVIDTGSTDGTQDIVRKFFESKGIPGEVIDHPWKNFEDARNTALNAVKGKADFGFWIDADEQLTIDPRFNVNTFKMNLSKFEGANVRVTYGGQKYYRMQFFNTKCSWRWYGPVHEVLINDDGGWNIGEAEGLGVLVTPDGNSWTSETQQQKYEGHAKILLDYVENDPKKDPRWVFYLAQSYRDAGTPENQAKALEWYQKRAEMTDGFWEEVYFAMLMVASLKGALNYPIHEILESYLKCGKSNIHRIEHLVPVVLHYHATKEFDIAYMYSSHMMKYAGKLPMPQSALFIDEGTYLWKIYDMHIISSWYSGRHEEAWETYKKLEKVVNQGGIVPEHEVARIKNNRQYFGK
jgi:glycosyltransferase involved in cell wall biosynthesis